MQNTVRSSLATLAGLRTQVHTMLEHTPSSPAKASASLSSALATLRSLRSSLSSLPLPRNFGLSTALATSHALAAQPHPAHALLASLSSAAASLNHVRERAAAAALPHAAAAVFPGLIAPDSGVSVGAKRGRDRSHYALTATPRDARPHTKRRKRVNTTATATTTSPTATAGAPGPNPLPPPLSLMFSLPSFAHLTPTSWVFGPATESRLSSLSVVVEKACIQARIGFTAAIGLAKSDALIPAHISLSLPSHPWFEKELEEVANDALDYFVSHSATSTALPRLLSWLHSYHDLFTRPCHACDSVLDNPSSPHGSPPLFRPYRVDRVTQGHALAPQLGTLPTTGSPLRLPLSLQASPPFHPVCFSHHTTTTTTTSTTKAPPM